MVLIERLAICDRLVQLQNKMSYDYIEWVWPTDAAHFHKKWLDSNRNLLTFMTTLDQLNLERLFDTEDLLSVR